MQMRKAVGRRRADMIIEPGLGSVMALSAKGARNRRAKQGPGD